VVQKPVQMIYLSIYATNPVIVKGIRMYCGIKNAERCSAVPVGEYICVRYTYESRVGQTHFKLIVKSGKPNSPDSKQPEDPIIG
jgi:hypothetical protein